jgi:hypothetical protein
VFDLAGGVITAVSAPHVTQVMLAAFEAAVRRAYRERKSPEELAKEVEKIDPSFGAVIRRNADPSIYLTILLLILLTIRSCLSVNIDMKVDVNQLIEQVVRTSPDEVVLAPKPPSIEPRPDEPPP